MVVTMPAASIPGLRHAKGVKSVEIDGTVTTMEPVTTAASTGDLEYDNAWGVTHIGSKAAHDAGIRGQGVKVAVIDTGVDYIHDQPPALEPPVVDPEFLNIYKGGYDFVNNDADPMDDNGHGTHVAGILAAEHNGYLVVGVAPAVDLYALKILDASGDGRCLEPDPRPAVGRRPRDQRREHEPRHARDLAGARDGRGECLGGRPPDGRRGRQHR